MSDSSFQDSTKTVYQKPPVSDKDRRVTLIALLIVFLLAALDMTILSTAMPRIVAELNGLELYAWVTTAYMLASTVLVPIYGKLGDLYGRKLILVIGISIFLLGSALCGISGEFGDLPLLGTGMQQLIVFRAIKGIGGAALFTSAIGIIADLYPPLQRAKFMGLFGAVFGIASIVGPALGGFLTDFATVTLFGHEIAGWRWVFYANIPLGIFALCMIAFKTPRLNHGTRGAIDFAGAFLLLVVFIPFLLALTWGGSRYPWSSPVLMSMFALSFLALLLFVRVEARTPDAIMPLSLFRSRVFVITNLSSFVIGMAFLGVVMFMPLFMQVVMGVNATNSGFSMFPLMAGLMASSIVSGRLVSKSGNYKPFMVAGAAMLIIGVFLLTGIGPHTTAADLSWRMFIVGLGLGPSQSLVNLIVQAAFPISQIGVATSSTQFFRQIGNTVGVAIFGTLLTLNLTAELPKQLPMLASMSGFSADLSQAQSIAMNPEALHVRLEAIPGIDVEQTFLALTTGIKLAFSNAITAMFSASLWIILLGFLITIFIPVIPLGSELKKPGADVSSR
ncbi:MAG: MDR family MFS transporter [Pseudohongiella sp.]|nr:MDR family MFS transporter [Pseudohongiella sp.]MDO9521292.1 MDR family MFS transporter [Pseudohongiella sp.]